MPPALDAINGMTTATLLDKWPSPGELAADLDLSYFTIAAWRRRDSIPPLHWDAVVQAANRRALRGVSFDTLRQLAETRPARRKAAALVEAQKSRGRSHEPTMTAKAKIVQGAQSPRANTVSQSPPPPATERLAMPLDQTERQAVSPDTKALYIRKYRQQKRVCEEAQGLLRSILKDAKTHGINTKSVIAGVAYTKIEPSEAVAELRDTIEVMKLLRIEVEQADLFAGMDLRVTEKTVREDDVWEADDAGYRAGRHGAEIGACKYPPGTELHVHWMAAWHKGQSSIAHEMGANAKLASSERARPKREQTKLDVSEPETVTLIDAEAEAEDAPSPAKKTRKRTAAAKPRARKQANGLEASGAPA